MTRSRRWKMGDGSAAGAGVGSLTGLRKNDILALMAVTKAWTDGRRWIVSKTLFDLLKIEVAAAYASKFFADVPTPIKAVLVGLMVGTAVAGFVLYPKEGD